jgi:hypothetical protein
MDVVDSLNKSNLILPAGDVRIGMKDYNIYSTLEREQQDMSYSKAIRAK